MGKKKEFHILTFVLTLLNIIAASALLSAYLCTKLSPEQYKGLAFFGLCYPYILIANILFVIIWIVARRKRFLFSLIIIIAGWSFVSRWVQLGGETRKENDTCFKVLSYNVQTFGLYAKNITTNKRDSIFALIEAENADIMCFQEYYHGNEQYFPNTSLLKQKMGKVYSYMSLDNHLGVVTFSKFPIINSGEIPFQQENRSNRAIFCDIIVGKDTLRIYNIHFQSVFFNEEDYVFAKQATSINDLSNDELKQGSLRLMRKVHRGGAKRAKQARILNEHIAQSPYKTIVCGDFNDVPCSYTYNQICRKLHLKDAFVESGKGIGTTLQIDEKLSFRIDYIFHHKDLKSYDFQVIDYKASDHYPIRAYISFNSMQIN